ncbi:SIMPL domain-containing protein [Candidatus Woesearchaeota archaeon]|nr:SIMPL domain-containing protein [Candidatus Woesearchaeota archaeon]
MENKNLENVISVVGSAELEVVPDQAEFLFSVITEKKDPKAAQKANAEIATRVLDALRESGVKDNQIQTSSYSTRKIGTWEKQKYVEKGYQVANTLKVSTNDLEQVGYLLDLVVNAGANNVGNVSFSLTDDLEAKTNKKLFTNACNDARSKAELLASTLGVVVGRPVYISEGVQNVGRQRHYGAARMSAMMDSAENAETPVQAQNVQTTAQISVSFEIKYS